jgi:hypothetical protein
MSIGDVFVALGFKVNDTALKAFDKAIVNLKNNMFALAAEGISTVYAIDKVSTGIKSAFDRAVGLKNFTRETGFDSYTAQVWQATGSLEAFNLTSEQALASIEGLSSALAKARITGQYPAEWIRLGIRPTDTPQEALEHARSAAQNVPLYQGKSGTQLFTNDVTSSMGLPAQMAAMLRFYKTSEEQARAAQEKGTIYTDEQIDKIVKAKTAVQNLEGSFEHLYTALTTNLTPEIESLSKYLNTAAKGLGFIIDKLDENSKKSTSEVAKARIAKDGMYGRTVNAVHATARAVPEVLGTGFTKIQDWMGQGINWWLDDSISKPSKIAASLKPRLPQIIDNTTPSNSKIAPLPNFGLAPGNDNGAMDLNNIDKILRPINGSNLPSGSTNHSWNVKIDVNGAESPRETAMEVRRQMEDITTFQQFGNGGLA